MWNTVIHGCKDPKVYPEKTSLEKNIKEMRKFMMKNDIECPVTYMSILKNKMNYSYVMDELLEKMYLLPSNYFYKF